MLKALLAATALALVAAPAIALPINSPVPTNAYITYAGLDWAWGGPCPSSGGCGDGDLSYQSTLGWRLPTTAELGLIPSNFASLFIFAGANVPQGGTDPVTGASVQGQLPAPGDMACASPYFSTTHTHCDFSDGVNGLWAGIDNPLTQFNEQLYVRADRPAPTDVPEPATIALLGAGLAGLGLRRKKRA